MRQVTRRQTITMLGGGAVLAADAAFLAHWQPASWWGAAAVNGDSPRYSPCYRLGESGYVPDGTAGRTAAYPLSAVRLLDGPFRDNQQRNLDYLLFLDPDRMLHTFRLNYGRPSPVRPCGGWESPRMEVRGHTTGHLLSGLALSYANTGSMAAKAAGEYLVGQLAQLQSIAPLAGYSPGYLSAFPEYYFDWLESGHWVWSPYYMIHKYLAGMIDQYQLAGVDQALDVAVRLADWVDWRTSRLSYAHMQQVLEDEFGGLPEALANLYRITGQERYLATAQRFYHARFLDPLAAGIDNLNGEQCNVNTPKVIACLRLWEETGNPKYHDIADNFWRIATQHHSYIIGGQGIHEHWGPPDVVAGALSNYTCEGCVTYNVLKLTRLLHFHDLERVDLLDYYERGLFNQMLGSQDPDSSHGFVCYYTGLSAGAFKQQPLNYFPHGDPDVYSTDYDDFTCDNATGLETQAKFADTIYTRDARGVYVNLFIPSEIHCADQNITLRQTTAFPDDPVVRITVTKGSATMILRVRVPSWTAGAPTVLLNGAQLRDAVVPSGAGGWVVVGRRWQPGDMLEVTLPMRLAFSPAPDQPSVQAVSYGPVVLSGLYGANYAADSSGDANPASGTQSGGAGSGGTGSGSAEVIAPLPFLDTASVRQTAAQPLTFEAIADGKPITMVPVARAQHEHFTVYWRTA
ncbi:MAG TPA: glycoside hydrolase family 127 protein [Trebonia sp.]